MCEWPLRFWWLGSDPLDRPVHRGSSDAEQFGKLSLGVGAEIVQLEQMFGLVRLQFGLLATEPALCLCHFHLFPGAHLIRSGSNSATIANTLNSNLPTGSVGSWIEPLG